MRDVKGNRTSLALNSCRLFQTDDLEEAQDRISRILQPHKLQMQSRSRSFLSRMSVLSLNDVSICSIAFGEADIDVPPLEDYAAFIMCLSGRGELLTGGRTIVIDSLNGAFCPAGVPLRGRFSPDCEQLLLRIPRGRLVAMGSKKAQQEGYHVALGQREARPFRALLRSIICEDHAVQLVRDDPVVATAYEGLLLRLLPARSDHAGEGTVGRGHVRPASVHRAISFIEANASANLRLGEIAVAAGVPERTLLMAFRRFEGESPIRHLQNVRLQRVRDRLMAAGPADDVTTLALSAGFGHLSRFSRDYAARFGERPSDTLRRHRYSGFKNISAD